MKNIFYLWRSLLLITGVISLLFFNSCKENTDSEIVFSIAQPTKIISVREPIFLSSISPEIKSEKKVTRSNKVNYDIIIPGREMQSAEFEPGEEKTIFLDGVSLSVPACGLSKPEIFCQFQDYWLKTYLQSRKR